MHKKTMLNIKIDTQLKTEAKKLADAMGIPLGTITTALIRKFVREKEIVLSLDITPSDYLKKAIVDAEKEYKHGGYSSYTDIDQMLSDLNT